VAKFKSNIDKIKTTRRAFLTLPMTLPIAVPNVLGAQSILEIPPAAPGERLAFGDGEFQFGELRVPAGRGPHPVAIVIHGGYWRARYDLKHIGHLCEALGRDGFATWSLEYRRLGNPGGGWPGTFDDVKAGASHLVRIAKAKALDLNRTIALGHSAGGHLVLWLAKQKVVSLRGVVALAAVSDLRKAWELKLSNSVVEELLGGSPAKVPERYKSASPMEMLPLGTRQEIIHGDQDDIVPVTMSRAYGDAAVMAGDHATMLEVLGAGHFDLIDPRSEAWHAVKGRALALVE
jgi:acetyl esterase/lipase